MILKSMVREFFSSGERILAPREKISLTTGKNLPRASCWGLEGLEEGDNCRGDVVRADKPMAVFCLGRDELDGDGGRGKIIRAEEVARQGDGRSVCGGTGERVVDFILDAGFEEIFVRDEGG